MTTCLSPFDVIHIIYPFRAINSNLASQTQRTWSNRTIMTPDCSQHGVAWPKQILQTALSNSGLLLALLITISNSPFCLLPPGAQRAGWWTAPTRRIQEFFPVDTPESWILINRIAKKQNKLLLFTASVLYFTKVRMDLFIGVKNPEPI